MQASAILNPQNSPESTPSEINTQNLTAASTPTEQEKPKVISFISNAMLVCALLYIITLVRITGIIWLIEWNLSQHNQVFYFFREFPLWGMLPIIFCLAAIITSYSALKLRTGSSFSFWLAAVTLLLTPLFVTGLSQWIMGPFAAITQTASQANFDLPHLTSSVASILFRNQTFVLNGALFIWLLVCFKKFTFPAESLTRKAKIFLTLLSVLLVIPVVIFVGTEYIRAADTDFGYSQAQSQSSYHLYKPQLLPVGLEYATKFTTGEEFLGMPNATKVIFDASLTEMLATNRAKTIVFTQVGVEPNFDLQEFIKNYMKEATTQQIPLETAANANAYILQKPLGEGYLTALVFLTPDNVLITFISPRATTDELTAIANSLQ